MKLTRWILLGVFFSGVSHAALSPMHQNQKDLDVIVGFIRQHPEVMMTLELIDFNQYKIVYKNGCEIYFSRATEFHLPGRVGPKPALIYDRATCSLDTEKK